MKPERELFCRYYTQNEELFGNATLSYAEAYGYKLDELPKDDAVSEGGKTTVPSSYDRAYAVCATNGGRLLRNAEVQARITTLLNEVLRDDVVDSQLAKVIMQDDKYDAKVAGIREYNKLRQRIIVRTDITSGGEPIKQINYVVPDGGNPSTDA